MLKKEKVGKINAHRCFRWPKFSASSYLSSTWRVANSMHGYATSAFWMPDVNLINTYSGIQQLLIWLKMAAVGIWAKCTIFLLSQIGAFTLHWICGCCLMAELQVWRALDGLDTNRNSADQQVLSFIVILLFSSFFVFLNFNAWCDLQSFLSPKMCKVC